MLSPHNIQAASQQNAVFEPHSGSKQAICFLRTTSRQLVSNMLSPNHIQAVS
ncbi:hypothetical protein DPMN_012241 [Dreissena polymorpha]|uniref:Uncharacterized protein n=1 Tax=Dreissena polymorpha TaxID=45954 RepID=A0A9D4S2J7_DREPO|nr:hypothetical protein DPMN_012241 [Dreissena polymorpha]